MVDRVKRQKLGSNKPGTFKPGNKAGVGNPGPQRPSFLTQALISQLHEIDKTTGQEKLHILAERLIIHALGGSYVVHIKGYKRGKIVRVTASEAWAVKEIFDRVQGRAVQGVAFDAGTGVINLTFEPGDKDA